MYKLIAVIFMGCLLCGCAAGSTFHQAGASDAQRDRDYFECQLAAGQAAGNDSFKEALYVVKCMRLKGYN